MKYISNAFSLNMLSDPTCYIKTRRIGSSEIPADVVSVIGHADTASVVSSILGRNIPANRINVVLNEDDVLYVAQYKGPRLPEGATALPEGASLEFLEVKVSNMTCRNCRAVDCNTCNLMSWFQEV